MIFLVFDDPCEILQMVYMILWKVLCIHEINCVSIGIHDEINKEQCYNDGAIHGIMHALQIINPIQIHDGS